MGAAVIGALASHARARSRTKDDDKTADSCSLGGDQTTVGVFGAIMAAAEVLNHHVLAMCQLLMHHEEKPILPIGPIETHGIGTESPSG